MGGAGQAAAVEAEKKASPNRITYRYDRPKSADLVPTYEWVKEVDFFKRLPEFHEMESSLVLPDAMQVSTEQCDEDNAFYYSDGRRIVMCYELIQDFYRIADEAAEDMGKDKAFADDLALIMMRLTMLHELGHALIDILELPAVGRQEDAADQLAAIAMLQYAKASDDYPRLARDLRLAGLQYAYESYESYSDSDFADVHSLGQQRYFDFLCLIYGHDPKMFAAVVTEDGLPESRAETCADDSGLIIWSWEELLAPYRVE